MEQTLAAPKLDTTKRLSTALPTPLSSIQVLQLHAGNMIGGIESMLLTLAVCGDLCPQLKQSFALTFDSDFAARLRRKDATIHLLPQVRLRHLPSIYQSRRRLRMLLRDAHFDAVVSHSMWIQLIFGDIVRDCGIPLVFWMHGSFDGHWLQRLASFHHPDFAICNSRWTRSTLERCYPRVPNAIIHYPVQARARPEDREQTRASLGINPEEVVILLAARMESWKGHRNLLRAAEKIRSSFPWRILIAGAPNSPAESAYFQSLQRDVASSAIANRVRFLGFRSDVPALIAASDIHCQPNETPEPFGIVFIEALQGGVPVVTYSMGGAQEILDANTAMVVEPGNIDGLAAALTKLIESRELRTRLGSAGPARAQALCDPARQMHRLADTLQAVIQRTRGVASS